MKYSFVKFAVLVSSIVVVLGCAHRDQKALDGLVMCPAPRRDIAAVRTCEEAFGQTQAPKGKRRSILDIYQALSSDDEFESNLVKSQLRGKLDAAIPLTPGLNAFRKKLLPDLINNANKREGLIRAMEAESRIDSFRKIRAGDLGKSPYDVVIKGAGPQGVIVAAAMKDRNPGLRILVIDTQDTAGANFRLGGQGFQLNSTNRASGPDRKPLPGQGNINELSGLPIQPSDLSANKYPLALDLGDSVVAGAYGVKTVEGVDILLGVFAETLDAKDSGDARAQTRLYQNGQELATISSQVIFNAAGLGNTKFPASVLNDLIADPSLIAAKDGELPKVLSSEDFNRLVTASNNPKGLFENKVMGLGGKGDSANTTIQYMIGDTGGSGVFGASNAQVRLPQKIYWLGQSAKTCKDVIDTFRSRYNSVGTIYRSSDLVNGVPLGEGIDKKVQSVRRRSRDGKLDVILADGQTVVVDHLVLATGYDNEPPKVDNNTIVYVMGKTTVSDGKVVKIAVYNKSTLEYTVGAGAGELAEDSELTRNIIQNYVSLFNNVPRVVATSVMVAGALKPLPQTQSQDAQEIVPLKRASGGSAYSIQNTFSIRSIGTEQTRRYLAAVLQHAIQGFSVPDGNLEVRFQLNELGQLIAYSPDTEIKPLIDELATTRDFFNTLALYFSVAPGSLYELQVRNGAANAGFQRSTTFPNLAPRRSISNTPFPLRSAQIVEAAKAQASADASRSVFQPTYVNNGIDDYVNGLFRRLISPNRPTSFDGTKNEVLSFLKMKALVPQSTTYNDLLRLPKDEAEKLLEALKEADETLPKSQKPSAARKKLDPNKWVNFVDKFVVDLYNESDVDLNVIQATVVEFVKDNRLLPVARSYNDLLALQPQAALSVAERLKRDKREIVDKLTFKASSETSRISTSEGNGIGEFATELYSELRKSGSDISRERVEQEVLDVLKEANAVPRSDTYEMVLGYRKSITAPFIRVLKENEAELKQRLFPTSVSTGASKDAFYTNGFEEYAFGLARYNRDYRKNGDLTSAQNSIVRALNKKGLVLPNTTWSDLENLPEDKARKLIRELQKGGYGNIPL